MVWKEFLSLKQTLPTEIGDYHQWHKGRNQYACWTITIQSQSVQSRFDAARTHLHEFLLQPYRRQAHVSLFVCGFMAEIKRYDDDYPGAVLTRHIEELRISKMAPFEIQIGGMNSFAAAPFLEVSDTSGGIGRIRSILSGTHVEIREGAYVPHLTLGVYSDYFETRRVAEKMFAFNSDSPITLRVDEISLTTYSAFEVVGPLMVKHRLKLGLGGDRLQLGGPSPDSIKT